MQLAWFMCRERSFPKTSCSYNKPLTPPLLPPQNENKDFGVSLQAGSVQKSIMCIVRGAGDPLPKRRQSLLHLLYAFCQRGLCLCSIEAALQWDGKWGGGPPPGLQPLLGLRIGDYHKAKTSQRGARGERRHLPPSQRDRPTLPYHPISLP